MTTHNRESWLNALTDALRPAFVAQGNPLPDTIHLSCGFPSKGAKSKVIGECHYAEPAPQIFIRPDRIETEEVAGIVIHELCHAALGPGHGHGPEFKRLATALGLTGRMKATTVGDIARALLEPILADLGPYPHNALFSAASPRKTVRGEDARLINVRCPHCGFFAKVLNEQSYMGRLTCPQDGEVLLTKEERDAL